MWRRLEIDMAAVLGTLGITILIIGLAQLLPVGVALGIGAPALPLALGAAGTLAVGLGLASLRRHATKSTRRESLAVVSLSWIAATLAAAVPFVAAGACGWVDAVFESASGLTTTGASIFVDIERLATVAPAQALTEPLATAAPLHLWRALTHWLGGAGIVLIVLVLTPFLDDAEALRQTQRQESSLLTERYRGSTRATVRGLLVVYVLATALNAALLMVAGLTAWDALLHAFATIATGGFSNRTKSLGAWGDAAQLVSAFFMVFGALNFAVLGRAAEDVRLVFQRQRRERGRWPAAWRAVVSYPSTVARLVWRNGETRTYVLLMIGASALVAGLLWGWGATARYQSQGLAGLWRAWVDGVFNVTSISSTTGFVTEDYLTWPPGAQLVLFILMLVGGCSGSTAGGLKLRRAMIVVKFAYREMRRLAHPRAVFPMRVGGTVVTEAQTQEAVGFVVLYLTLAIVVAFLVSLTGVDLITAGGASASTLGSVGPAWGECGPYGNYQGILPVAKVVLTFAMLLGRLEILPLIATFLPSFWLRRRAGRST